MAYNSSLHSDLLNFSENVYFQPPNNLTIKYPCIICAPSDAVKKHAGDSTYLRDQGYNLTVISTNPIDNVGQLIEDFFQHCTITQWYVVGNLHHTSLKLFY